MTIHGKRYDRTYQAWMRIKYSCLSPTHNSFGVYGAKGYTICDNWKNFSGFYLDMGDIPNKCTGISLIDEEIKVFCKENCKWSVNPKGRKRKDKVKKPKRKVLKNPTYITLALENDLIEFIKSQARRKSLDEKRMIYANDLIREAIYKYFPFTRQSDLFSKE